MHSRTLDGAEELLWIDSDTYRAEVREALSAEAPHGAHVEVYGSDGITLDAWEVER